MKKIIVAAICVMLFASCWHSEERAINDRLSTYTVKENGYLGIKKTGAPAGESLTEAIYVQADEYNGYILAQCKKDPDGVSRWTILDPNTAKPISKQTYEKVWIGNGYFTMEAKEMKYFFAGGAEIYGPKSDLAYYPNKDLLFSKGDGKWGCNDLIPEAYSRLLYITDGSDARFVGIDGKKAVLIDLTGKIIKKNIPVATVTKMEEKATRTWTYQSEVSVLIVKSVKTAI